MTTKYDQVTKELLTTYPTPFLRLAAPRLAERIDPGTIALAPEEHYPGSPTGRERRPDLVSRALAKAGKDGSDEGEVLLHAEIELRYRTAKVPKLLDYHRGLSLEYGLSVHTLVLYLRGGPPGAQDLVYEERSLGRVVASVGYYSLGLSRMSAAEALASPEPLAWALAALMRPAKGQSRAQLGLACVRRIADASSDLDRREQNLLFRYVWVCGRFEGKDAEEFDTILAELDDDDEVEEMKMSMMEFWTREARAEARKEALAEGMEKGRKEGEASLLKRLLRRRFDQLPRWIDQRLKKASRRELEAWAERVLDAKRLEDVFSSA